MRAMVVAAFLVASGCVGSLPTPRPSDVAVRLEPVVDGLASPVFVTALGDGSGRLLVVEQAGTIRVLNGTRLEPRPLLDISQLVEAGGERGLFTVAPRPPILETRTYYVSYTKKGGDSVVAHYHAGSQDVTVVDSGTGTVTLEQSQPQGNHNGGMLAFGPDGFLYVGFGDGGGAGDRGAGHAAEGNGQSLSTWLGKILRLDVNGTETYRAAATNPELGPDARPEIWSYGLRNPWRFSFDGATGDLWIADVGQWEREEVNVQPASSRGGENYGWNVFEGTKRFRAGSAPGHVPPLYEYSRAGGQCSVTGGYVYRGADIPRLQGLYVFGDYCSGHLWSLSRAGEARTLLETGLRISSLGEDEAGELFVVHHGGSLHRLRAG